MSSWEIAFLGLVVFEFSFFIVAVGGAQWVASRRGSGSAENNHTIMSKVDLSMSQAAL